MKKQLLLSCISASLINLCTATVADAALLSRLGGQAYYDDVLNITWLADANYAQTSGYDADGLMTWPIANTWANNLNIDGVTGWRLPTMIDTNDVGCDWTSSGTDCGYNVQTGSAATIVYSELASLWMDTLGNLPYRDTDGNAAQAGWGLTNSGPFQNIQLDRYFTGLEYELDTRSAWRFSTKFGDQTSARKSHEFYGWAVHSGDVSPVPVPTSLWLFSSGIFGLIGFARRKKQA